MTEPRFAISKTFKYDGLTMTVTIRQGATEKMVRDTLRHYVVGANSIRKGTDVPPALHLRDDYGLPPDHGCTRVNIFGDVNGISINKCNEFTTAMDLATNAAMLKLATDLSGGANGSSANEKGGTRDLPPEPPQPPTPPEPPPMPPPEQESTFRPPEQRAGTVSQPVDGNQRGVSYKELLQRHNEGDMIQWPILKIERALTEDGVSSIYKFYPKMGNKPGQFPIPVKAYTDNDGDMLALKPMLDALSIDAGQAKEGRWTVMAEIFAKDDGSKFARARQLIAVEPERVEEPF